MREAVVLIHGLWMSGFDMSLLRRRLKRRAGYQPYRFAYSSLSGDLASNIEQLNDALRGIDAEHVHLVGHSLGGVLGLHALTRHPDPRIRRVVCLGSPLTDSAAARKLNSWSLGMQLIGKTLRDSVLDNPLTAAPPNVEVGVIAGTVSAGAGLLLGVLERPNDGVVEVSETRLPGIADHIELPVNHIGLVLSPKVAAQTAAFLRNGQFD